MARILLSAWHRTNIFQIFPGISYFCTNNKVENRFFPRSSSYFFFDSHSFLHQLFQTHDSWKADTEQNLESKPKDLIEQNGNFWTVFHRGVRENNFPTFTYHIHHYGNVLCAFSNLRVWGKKRDFYSETQPTAAILLLMNSLMNNSYPFAHYTSPEIVPSPPIYFLWASYYIVLYFVTVQWKKSVKRVGVNH